jgi:hypothetical protein
MSPAKRPRDVNELAKRLVDEATGEAKPVRGPLGIEGSGIVPE